MMHSSILLNRYTIECPSSLVNSDSDDYNLDYKGLVELHQLRQRLKNLSQEGHLGDAQDPLPGELLAEICLLYTRLDR